MTLGVNGTSTKVEINVVLADVDAAGASDTAAQSEQALKLLIPFSSTS